MRTLFSMVGKLPTIYPSVVCACKNLRQIAEFYKIEAEIRGINPGQRLSARKARTAPLVAEFGDWLTKKRSRASAKSRRGEKLAYIARHWDGLQTDLADSQRLRLSARFQSRQRLISRGCPIGPSELGG